MFNLMFSIFKRIFPWYVFSELTWYFANGAERFLLQENQQDSVMCAKYSSRQWSLQALWFLHDTH